MQLEKLVRDAQRDEDQDRVWVEVQESLGDFHWTRRNQQNWGAAWPHYQQALDWWAGARDIELARAALSRDGLAHRSSRRASSAITTTATGAITSRSRFSKTRLKIAQTDNDKAHAHFLIAMTLRNQGGEWEQRARVPEEFEGAIKIGKTTDWYDDALYNYAEWMAGQGRIVPLAERQLAVGTGLRRRRSNCSAGW